jgi:hypothetical protein
MGDPPPDFPGVLLVAIIEGKPGPAGEEKFPQFEEAHRANGE